LRVAFVIALGALATIVYVFIETAPELLAGSPHESHAIAWLGVLRLFALLAAIGGLLGSIVALDRHSPFCVADRPWLRAGLCAVFAVVIVLCGRHPAPAALPLDVLAFTALVGAILGGLGWAWARVIEYF